MQGQNTRKKKEILIERTKTWQGREKLGKRRGEKENSNPQKRNTFQPRFIHKWRQDGKKTKGGLFDVGSAQKERSRFTERAAVAPKKGGTDASAGKRSSAQYIFTKRTTSSGIKGTAEWTTARGEGKSVLNPQPPARGFRMLAHLKGETETQGNRHEGKKPRQNFIEK